MMKRSEFLKVIGAGTATALLGGLPAIAKGANTQKDENIKRISTGLTNQEAKVDKPVTAIVIGAGSRGTTYAGYAKQYPGSLTIVGVSDINEERKRRMAEQHQIPEDQQFGDWSEVFRKPKFADVVIISTPDNLHFAPCMKALEMGYDVLLEKPVAQSVAECKKIQNQAKKHNRIVGVCHVLRYAPYFVALKDVIDKGMIGDIVSIQHFEAIRHHHMAHSYVRGNWHDSKKTTPIIIAKSCHDLDLMRWIINKDCKQVSAFGDLRYFKKENAPEGSSTRCTTCSIEKECPYSAIKIYTRDKRHLYVFDLPADKSKHHDYIMKQLETSNYGQCVFHCNNDQCDHYVMNMEFDGGTTVAFSMEGHTSYGGRHTRIMGTKGDIVGDMNKFTVTDFLTNNKSVWDEDISKLPGYSSHGGGDWGILKDFVLAVSHQDAKYLSSTIDVSIESHVMGFKAEESRVKKKVVKI